MIMMMILLYHLSLSSPISSHDMMGDEGVSGTEPVFDYEMIMILTGVMMMLPKIKPKISAHLFFILFSFPDSIESPDKK